jgi:hypothetical protein
VEVPVPVGDALTANLLWELVRTGTLVPPDLALVDRADAADSGDR